MATKEQNRRHYIHRKRRIRDGLPGVPRLSDALAKSLERGWLSDADEQLADASIRAACEAIHKRRAFKEDVVAIVELPVVCGKLYIR